MFSGGLVTRVSLLNESMQESAGSRLVDRLRKIWIDTLEDHLRKRFGCGICVGGMHGA